MGNKENVTSEKHTFDRRRFLKAVAGGATVGGALNSVVNPVAEAFMESGGHISSDSEELKQLGIAVEKIEALSDEEIKTIADLAREERAQELVDGVGITVSAAVAVGSMISLYMCDVLEPTDMATAQSFSEPQEPNPPA